MCLEDTTNLCIPGSAEISLVLSLSLCGLGCCTNVLPRRWGTGAKHRRPGYLGISRQTCVEFFLRDSSHTPASTAYPERTSLAVVDEPTQLANPILRWSRIGRAESATVPLPTGAVCSVPTGGSRLLCGYSVPPNGILATPRSTAFRVPLFFCWAETSHVKRVPYSFLAPSNLAR